MYTLDTNAVIYYLKDDPAVVRVLSDIFHQRVPVYVSTISEIELFAFPGLDSLESATIEEILTTVAILPVDSRIARMAGALRRTYRLPLADSAIAATALFTGTILLTRNVSDFQKVPNLSVKKV